MFYFKRINLFLFDLYNMDTLPSAVVNIIFKYSHQMLFSDCIEQLKLYRVYSVLNVSALLGSFLKYAQYSLNGVMMPCIDINNINVSSRSILNSIHSDNKFSCNKY